MEVIQKKLINRIDCDLEFETTKCHSIVSSLFDNFDPDYVDFALIVDAIYDVLAEKEVGEFDRVLKGFETMKLDHDVTVVFISKNFMKNTNFRSSILLNDSENAFFIDYHSVVNNGVSDNSITLSTKGFKNVFSKRVLEHKGVEYTLYFTKSLDSLIDYGYWIGVKSSGRNNLPKVLVKCKVFDIERLCVREFDFDRDTASEEYPDRKAEIIDLNNVRNNRVGLVLYSDISEVLVQFKLTFV